MTQQIIYVGAAPNDGDGDPIRTAFIKSNDNFTQLYQRVQTTPPTSFYGKVGDQAGMYAYDPTYFYYCFANYDAVTPIWAEIAQVGNISVTSIAYGNSNVSIASPGSNITIGVNGTSNVATFTSQGLTVSNTIIGNSLTISANISAVGNISGTYFLGNGSQLSGLPQNYGNANVESFLPTYSGTLAPSAIYTDNYFYANGDPFVSGSNYSKCAFCLITGCSASNFTGCKFDDGIFFCIKPLFAFCMRVLHAISGINAGNVNGHIKLRCCEVFFIEANIAFQSTKHS